MSALFTDDALTGEVRVLPSSRHGVDDPLVTAVEDEDHGLQLPGFDVEPQPQLPVGRR